MNMQLQDILEKDSSQGTVASGRGRRARGWLAAFIGCLLFFAVGYWLLGTVYYSFAQQPAQQKQPQQQGTQQPVPQKSLEEERMNILKGDIQKEIDEYKKLKKEVEVVQKAQDEKKQESLAKIAKMFESMTAEDAAKKIEKLDEDTAVIILNSLKPKSAGKILAQIEDEKAASLSKKILIKGKILQEKSSQ